MAKNKKYNIGFMQGRLSPQVDGKIQAFPWSNWQEEFTIAVENEFHMMEWTLDQERLYDNPLMNAEGQKKIRDLREKFSFAIPSLTGDCFMQAPFWKSSGNKRESLQKDFMNIAEGASGVGIQMIVVPLVDKGSLENKEQEDLLVTFLMSLDGFLIENKLKIIFESDFIPNELKRFVSRFNSKQFGINYDIGNSASLGFLPKEEFAEYGNFIMNVHVKDRLLHGTTVPLGAGNANFESVFYELAKIGYKGNFILQTARAANENHAEVLCQYRQMTESWIDKYEL